MRLANTACDDRTWKDEYHLTFTKLDAEGKPLWIRDARGNLVMQYITPPKPTRLADQPNEDIPSHTDPATGQPIYSAPCYDIAGNLLFQHSMDAGDRWMINDAAGKPDGGVGFQRAPGRHRPVRRAAPLLHRVRRAPPAHRPLAADLGSSHPRRSEKPRSPTSSTRAIMVERFEYCDANSAAGTPNAQLGADQTANLIGQLIRHYDPSGLTETVRRDFKGNVLEVNRRLNNQPTESLIDWQGDSLTLVTKLETEIFRQITEYDALNRMTLHYNWHRDPTSVAAYSPVYNQRGALKSESLLVRASRTSAGPTGGVNAGKPDAIQEIRYNAKGQKTFLHLGNGTVTQYEYDPFNFRLRQIFTNRPPPPQAFPTYRSNLQDNGVFQQLLYTYDPVGNVTEVEDQAYKPVFFNGGIAEPKSQYEHDALYRLVWASGRETDQGRVAAMNGDEPDLGHGFPVTDQTLRRYIQLYEYDPAGNFLTMEHRVPTDSSSGWTRHYTPATDSNRLLRTWTGTTDWDHAPTAKRTEYLYDTHGSMRNLARTAAEYHLRWDHRDMIGSIDLGGGGQAYYQYDAGTQRTRKIIERNPPDAASHTIKEERIYLGGYELYRRYIGDPSDPVEEIESHHLLEGQQRVLLVDDVVRVRAPRPDDVAVAVQTLFRYQYNNHLGSACLELDDQSKIISYEEFRPYGTSAYRAVNGTIQAPPKRYRYTGMERDEESGLSYHSARYLLSWLGSWVSTDPIGIGDGLNIYEYVHGNPVVRVDNRGMADSTVALGDQVVPVQKEMSMEEATAAINDTWKWDEPNSEFAESARQFYGEKFQAAYKKKADAGMKGVFTVWALLGIAVVSGVAGGLVGGAILTAGGGAEATVGVKLFATGVGGAVGGGVDVGGEQLLRAGLHERLLSRREAAVRIGLSIAVPIVAEAGAAVIGRVVSKIRLEKELSLEAKLEVIGLTKKEAGPVVASAKAGATGEIYAGRNPTPTRELHPVLEERRLEHLEITGGQSNTWYGGAWEEHAEIKAVNDALWAREAQFGPQTAADLRDIVVHVESTAGLAKPRCTRCFLITKGVQTSSALEAAEKKQFEDILRGLYDNRPF